MKKKGSTLSELLLYSVLLMLVLSVAYTFFRLAQGYVHKTRAQVELQQNVGLAGASLVRDLSEAWSDAVTSFPNASAPSAPAGVVFLMARDSQNRFVYEVASGYPIWQRYVGYFLDADPLNPAQRALYRAEVIDRGGLPTVNPQSPPEAGVTTAWLRDHGVNRKLIAAGFRPESPAAPHGGLDLYSLASGSTTHLYSERLTMPVWVDLELLNPSTGSSENSLRSRLSVLARN